MTKPLKLSLMVGADYDRTRPLRDGTVKADGIALDITVGKSPHATFAEILSSDTYDGGEMSLSFLSTLVSKHGDDLGFVGLPVFLSRMFRHGNILINTDSGIQTPKDLEGRVVGLPEYGLTLGVWVRGILKHEYGVSPESIRWRTGRPPAVLDPGTVRYPENVNIEQLGTQSEQVAMLGEGKLDAYAGVVPASLPPKVRRLFPNYAELERDYYRRTAIFPIMHVMVLRRRIVKEHPWVVGSLYRAFCEARDLAIQNLWSSSVLKVTAPWMLASIEEQTRAMNGNLWPYGLAANRTALAAFADYSYEQGLLWRTVRPEELCMDEAHAA